MPPRRVVLFASLLFVLSGAAGLVYEVAWQRILALTTGVGVTSIAIITAAFMAGLGVGSHAGGVISARLTPRRSLQAFAVVEAGVAGFALLSPILYYDVLYQRAPGAYAGLGRAVATHLLTLLPPTALMGMSLPLLVRGLVWERHVASRTIGFLYGANALGAALGAALTPWVLLRFLDVGGALAAGAACSGLAALGVLMLKAPDTLAPGPRPEAAEESTEPARPLSLWVALYALSGFVSLSLEMAWFRVLDVTAKGAAFTFGTLLAVYLLAIGLGTLFAARYAPGVRRPLRLFLGCQCGVTLATAVPHLLLVWLPADLPGLAWLVEYGHRQYGVKMVPFETGAFLAVYALLPLLLFGASAFLMGVGFPILQRATQGDPAVSGRRVGLLQAANIAGCVLGSLLTGLVLFDHVGTGGVPRVLTLLAGLLAVAGFWMLREARFAGLAVLLAVLALALPDNERLWRRLHGEPDAARTFVQEDMASVTALTPEGDDRFRLWINGRHNSWLPFGWLHTVIGALPTAAHSAPLEVAVVGLGSGDTAWASGFREETRRIAVFEIASSQVHLIRGMQGAPGMGRLDEFLADPRFAITLDDGRRRLTADGRSYDVVVADSVDYDTSMVTYLHSVEYFRMLKSRLRAGGLVCTLAKTPRIRATLHSVFPHVVAFRDDLLMASPDPITIDKELWIGRLRSERAFAYLGKARAREVIAFVEKAGYWRPEAGTDDFIHDLEPKDEFFRPSGP